MHPALASTAVWIIALAAVAGILLRPFRSHEWPWAVGAAIVLVAARLTTPASAWGAIERGASVYAFLAGILLLAQIARVQGVFEAFAARAAAWSGRSPGRLFLGIYAAGTAVTALLSNDTTVIVLTPAVLAIAGPAGIDAVPGLYACALAANAASFVLPFSNPANFVIYGRGLPPLGPWLAAYGAAALASVVVTYVVLRFAMRARLHGTMAPLPAAPLHPGRPVAVAGLVVGAAAMLVSAAAGWDVGLAALVPAILTLLVMTALDPKRAREAAAGAAWQILPLVAGLFVVIDAVDKSGALDAARDFLTFCSQIGAPMGPLLAAASAAVTSDVANNLPVALAAGFALSTVHVSPETAHAAVIGIDLGPNIAVTGSLATLLWLVILRREGRTVSALDFFRIGAATCVPALIAAALLAGTK